MKKTTLLIILTLAILGCDALKLHKEPTKPTTTEEPTKPTTTPDEFVTEAKSILTQVLDDWVFGEANYKLKDMTSNKPKDKTSISFADLHYGIGDPLSSYEILAGKEVDSDEFNRMANFAVRLTLPTRGGIAEIKKNVSYTVIRANEDHQTIFGGLWLIL